jgi:hypothetical protein
MSSLTKNDSQKNRLGGKSDQEPRARRSNIAVYFVPVR